ncbi:MAG TPA: thioesterase family protein [Sphingomonas sp.]
MSDWVNTIRTVADGDIDRLGHVNNAVYLRWIEDAVHGHWTGLSTPAEFVAYAWVAVRHEIDYRRPAHVAERLDIKTRIVGIRRARAWYETVVSRGDTMLADARSCWCCIDARTHRMTVIPADAAARFLPAGGGGRAIHGPLSRGSPPGLATPPPGMPIPDCG